MFGEKEALLFDGVVVLIVGDLAFLRRLLMQIDVVGSRRGLLPLLVDIDGLLEERIGRWALR